MCFLWNQEILNTFKCSNPDKKMCLRELAQLGCWGSIRLRISWVHSHTFSSVTFTCSQKWKVHWKETTFQFVNKVKSKMAVLLNWASDDDLQHWFEQLEIRMQQYIQLDRRRRVHWRGEKLICKIWKQNQFFTAVPLFNSHTLYTIVTIHWKNRKDHHPTKFRRSSIQIPVLWDRVKPHATYVS
jgi:hypothetical protein